VFFPYSEILLGLLLAYTGIIFSMVESSFRYYLLKKAEKNPFSSLSLLESFSACFTFFLLLPSSLSSLFPPHGGI
jgi:hypothetical protein